MFAAALGATGTTEAISVLIDALRSDIGPLRQCAAWALGELRATEGREHLAAMLAGAPGGETALAQTIRESIRQIDAEPNR
jgi:HEAT repeat protein